MARDPRIVEELLAQDQSLRELVGANLALLRTAQGKGLIDWAREFPEFLSSTGKLKNWEDGRHYPPNLFLLKLCEVYHVRMDYFFTRLPAVIEKTLHQSRRVRSS